MLGCIDSKARKTDAKYISEIISYPLPDILGLGVEIS